MIVILGTLRFPPENIARLRPHLQTLVAQTCEHDGCVSYDVAEDLFEPGLIRFAEEWPDQETLGRHMQAPHMPAWRAACAEFGVSDRNFTVYTADQGRPL